MANNGTKRLADARAYILANWEITPDREMAAALDTTKDNIAHMRARLGLTRSLDNRRALYAVRPNKSGWKRRPTSYL